MTFLVFVSLSIPYMIYTLSFLKTKIWRCFEIYTIGGIQSFGPNFNKTIDTKRKCASLAEITFIMERKLRTGYPVVCPGSEEIKTEDKFY